MTRNELQELVRDIVKQACELKNKYTKQRDIPVHYAAIFSHTQEEYEGLLQAGAQLGMVYKETPTGPLYKIESLDTVAGSLRLLKIRAPDPTRPERGDADFAVKNYPSFKSACESRSGFKLIQRETFEMIELTDPAFDVRVYFSNPPVEEQYGLV